MVAGVGSSVGNVTNAGIAGDVGGAIGAASDAATFIPGAGTQVAGVLNAGGGITNSAIAGDTAGIVSGAGAALGSAVPGQAGSIIQNLTPAASGMTTSI